MLENESPVTIDALRDEVAALKQDGWRLVTFSSIDLKEEGKQLIYHFDKDLKDKHLRLTIANETVVPSVSNIYFAALLIENELKDQFGFNFSDMVIDFGCQLYLESEVQHSPFCSYIISNKEKPAKKEG